MLRIVCCWLIAVSVLCGLLCGVCSLLVVFGCLLFGLFVCDVCRCSVCSLALFVALRYALGLVTCLSRCRLLVLVWRLLSATCCVLVVL